MAKTLIRRWKCTCEKCGREWESRTTNPKQCPECKTFYWNEKKKEETENE